MTGFSEDAATPYGAGLDKRSFFAWVQRQDAGRYELKNGHIVMHAGSSKPHARLSTNITVALANRIDREQWLIAAAEYAVEIGEVIRYPDVVVTQDHAADHLATSSPILIVEVLSPSSVARDMTEKLAEYTSLASLDCYIVASQDEPIVWVWQRDAETRAFPKLPTEIAGREAHITLTSLAIDLPLTEIYRGIGSP